MHDIKWIRENPAVFDAGLKRRGLEPLSASLLAIDEKRRTAITHLERALARRNAASKEIGEAKKKKDDAHAEDLMIEVTQLKAAIPELEKTPRELEVKLNGMLAEIPNLPLDEVPDGGDEHGNLQRHVFGKVRNYAFAPKAHDDLGGALGFMDFETAAKLSGARFVVLKKGLARLERAIGQFMLDLHTNEHGYTEVNPPLLVRDNVMFGTGQLPKFRDDQYFSTSAETFAGIERMVEQTLEISYVKDQEPSYVDNINRLLRNMYVHGFSPESIEGARLRALSRMLSESNGKIVSPAHEPTKPRYWLIPTAEVPLTNLVRESILDEKELPMRLTALTPCFRAEAGAAGRDTRGMIRQHQFTKVELVSITTPENSRDEHERMLACAEEVLRQLDLHYRVMTLCAGDMGFSAQKTYDIEVWMPGQGEGGAYREISSCSVCGDFQARRMDARYRGPDGKPRFVHTLNGSGTAVGRALIAVMETYQQQGGSIAVPDVLQPYMGGLKVIEQDR
ncbi:MAG: seryl-tRNA synthetase [Bradyrhizobium sp.]|jgi:seryl-tRNA synthetase|nr:seryl-tRNA synthetase [Bradyrhizobium sp.]